MIPGRFSDLVGHQAAAARFLRAVRQGSLPPAMLLTGAEGIGKRTFALLGAKYLNCQAPLDDDVCGTCASCLKIDNGMHPDVRLIVPDGRWIKIDQAREISSDIQFRPFEGKRKVYILDPADGMTEETANGMLKTLEEAPSYAWIALITSQPRDLPSTILSRCPVLPLSPVPASGIEALLRERGVAPGAAAAIARVAAGSVGLALTLDWKLLEKERERGLEFLQYLARPSGFHSVRRFWTSLSTEEKKREWVESFLRTLLILLRDLMLIREGFESRITHVDLAPRLKESARLYSFQAIAGLETSIRRALDEAQRNVNVQILLESLYFERPDAIP